MSKINNKTKKNTQGAKVHNHLNRIRLKKCSLQKMPNFLNKFSVALAEFRCRHNDLGVSALTARLENSLYQVTFGSIIIMIMTCVEEERLSLILSVCGTYQHF